MLHYSLFNADTLTHRDCDDDGIAANSAAQICGVGLAAAARVRAEIALHSSMRIIQIIAMQGSYLHASMPHR